MSEGFRLEGGEVTSARLEAGQSVRITSLEGPQVVDVWAFSTEDLTEFLSTEHTRSCLQRLIPRVGDALYTNRRRPVLTVTQDTSPGVHDLLLSACDPARYALLGCTEYHRNCADNLRSVLEAEGCSEVEIPSPFNVFENVELRADGSLAIVAPVVSAGEFIELTAALDVLVVMSACPMDLAMTNGNDGKLRPVTVTLS